MTIQKEFGGTKMHPVERYAYNMWRRPDDYVKSKKKKKKIISNERKD